MRHKLSVTGLAYCSLLLAGCGASLPSLKRDTQAQPAIDRNSTEASLVAGYLEICMKAAHGTPAEQAEALTNTHNDYAAAPTPSRVLRYAMVLATPGHGGSDPVVAQRLLREVLASPETLLPAERSLASLQLQQVERQQALQAEVRRLQQVNERSTNDKIAQLTKNLKSESDEVIRLRKALADAQAKLDAIANIEGSTNNRRTPTPEGRKP